MVTNAWALIGWDHGPIRIVGGRAIYEGVLFNDAAPGGMVKLARVESTPDHRLREVSRYVDGDTMIEWAGEGDPPFWPAVSR